MRKVVTNINRLKNDGYLAMFRVHTVANATIDQVRNDPEIRSLFGKNFDLATTSLENVFLLKTDLRVIA